MASADHGKESGLRTEYDSAQRESSMNGRWCRS